MSRRDKFILLIKLLEVRNKYKIFLKKTFDKLPSCFPKYISRIHLSVVTELQLTLVH